MVLMFETELVDCFNSCKLIDQRIENLKRCHIMLYFALISWWPNGGKGACSLQMYFGICGCVCLTGKLTLYFISFDGYVMIRSPMK